MKHISQILIILIIIIISGCASIKTESYLSIDDGLNIPNSDNVYRIEIKTFIECKAYQLIDKEIENLFITNDYYGYLTLVDGYIGRNKFKWRHTSIKKLKFFNSENEANNFQENWDQFGENN